MQPDSDADEETLQQAMYAPEFSTDPGNGVSAGAKAAGLDFVPKAFPWIA